MSGAIKHRSRDFTIARLRRSLNLYYRSIDYDGVKRKYFIPKPKIVSTIHCYRFYSSVRPFLTTRFENE